MTQISTVYIHPIFQRNFQSTNSLLPSRTYSTTNSSTQVKWCPLKSFQLVYPIHSLQSFLTLIIYQLYMTQTTTPNTLPPEQADLLQRFPQILLPQSRKKSAILEEYDSQQFEELSFLQSQVDQFQTIPDFPQISAQQIESMTSSQLAFVLDRISPDQLDDQQKEYLLRIKQTLSIASPLKRQSDTKNIPKNFTKAMFTYAMSNVEFLNKLLHKLMLSSKREQFIEWLKENKKAIHNIKQLKCLNGQDHEFVRPFKLIQNHFLKHNAPCYIFNSRIENTPAHLKAKQNITKQLFHEQNEK